MKSIILSAALFTPLMAMEREFGPGPQPEYQKATFAEAQSLFQEYKANNSRGLRVTILSKLNQLLITDALKDVHKGEAVTIARRLRGYNLVQRLKLCNPGKPSAFGYFTPLPKEVIDKIFGYLIPCLDIMTVAHSLTTSKAFNAALLAAPIRFNGVKYNDFLTDSIIGKMVVTFPCMTTFELANSLSITPNGFAYLANLESLGTLQLASMDVTDAFLLNLSRLTNLTRLNLRDTHVTGAGVGGLTKLTYLSLARTEVVDESLRGLRNLTNLTVLNLDDTKIRNNGLRTLLNLTKLITLYIRRTHITDAGLGYFTFMTNLTSLYLGYNKEITNDGMVYLAHLTKLNLLNLNNTSVTDVAKDELQVIIPTLKFY